MLSLKDSGLSERTSCGSMFSPWGSYTNRLPTNSHTTFRASPQTPDAKRRATKKRIMPHSHHSALAAHWRNQHAPEHHHKLTPAETSWAATAHRCWEPNSAARDSSCSRAGLHSPNQPKASACTCPKDANFAAMCSCAPGSVPLNLMSAAAAFLPYSRWII